MGNYIDVLGRTAFVDSIFEMMLNASNSSKTISFAIDGQWGVGKSFVLNMLEDKLEKEQNEETAYDRFLVIRYNSWEYDYYEEPIIAIIAAIQDSLIEKSIDAKCNEAEDKVLSAALRGIKELACQVTKNKLGIDVTEIIKGDSEKVYSDDYSGLKRSIITVRKNMEKISEKVTVVIMIDELDRCMPEYVIKILNRCNHLFWGLPNVQIVYAMNNEQVHHSVKKIFGDDVKVDKYLKKFIDNIFNLDMGCIDETVVEKFDDFFMKFEEEHVANVKNQIVNFINSMDLNIRTIEKIIDKVNISHNISGVDCNDGVLMFELVTAFLSEIYGVNLEKILSFDEERGGIYIRSVGREKRDEIDDVFNEWNYVGINQYTLAQGVYRKPLDNQLGRMITCLTEVFKGKGERKLMYSNLEGIDQQIADCKKFWGVYKMSK